MNKLFFQISVLVVALMLTFANIKATDSPVFTTADSTKSPTVNFAKWFIRPIKNKKK